MKKVTISIDCANAAFDDVPCFEVAKILRHLAAKFDSGIIPQTIRDSNGNKVGLCKVTSKRGVAS